jgi:hypothetical protein
LLSLIKADLAGFPGNTAPSALASVPPVFPYLSFFQFLSQIDQSSGYPFWIDQHMEMASLFRFPILISMDGRVLPTRSV